MYMYIYVVEAGCGRIGTLTIDTQIRAEYTRERDIFPFYPFFSLPIAAFVARNLSAFIFPFACDSAVRVSLVSHLSHSIP